MLLLEKLLISPCFLLGILIAVALGGWLFAIKLYTPSDKFWRASNLISLIFTCLGILGVVKDSRQIFYERETYKYQNRIKSVYRWQLIYNLNEELYNREFVKTQYSPSNLESLQEDYDATCQWIKDNKGYFIEHYSKLEPIIIDSISYPVLATQDQELSDFFNRIQKSISEYNRDVAEMREYKRGQKPNFVELFYIIVAPLFLAIGLGWNFVKFFAKR